MRRLKKLNLELVALLRRYQEAMTRSRAAGGSALEPVHDRLKNSAVIVFYESILSRFQIS